MYLKEQKKKHQKRPTQGLTETRQSTFKNKKTKDQNEINVQSPKLETQLLKNAFSYPSRQIIT